MSLEHRVERAGGAAVGVGDEDAVVAALELGQLRVDRGRDPRRRRVQLGGQAADVDVLPAVQVEDGEHLARDRPAGEDQHARIVRGPERDLVLEERRGHDAATAARRASTSACAVSAATAASRQ